MKKQRKNIPTGLKFISENYGFNNSKQIIQSLRKSRTTPVGFKNQRGQVIDQGK